MLLLWSLYVHLWDEVSNGGFVIIYFHLRSLEELHTFTARSARVGTADSAAAAGGIMLSFLSSSNWLKKRFCFTSGLEDLVDAFNMCIFLRPSYDIKLCELPQKDVSDYFQKQSEDCCSLHYKDTIGKSKMWKILQVKSQSLFNKLITFFKINWKWYKWTGLQGRNWDTHVENKRIHTKGGKWQEWWWWWDELGDWDWHVYTNMYKMDNWLGPAL